MPSIEDIIKAALTADETAKAHALAALQGKDTRTPSVEPYLTLRRLAKELNISVCSIWRWRCPSRNLGGKPRYRISEVEAYLASPEFKARTDELRQQRKQKTGAR